MNSQDLESIIVDAARDQLIETPELEEMLAHTSACRECAARLADQRTLTAGLGRLAELTRNEEAPGRVEMALRAAYRERILAPAQATSSLVPTARRWTRWVLATAAAAAILAVLALTSWRVAPTESNKPGSGSTATGQAPQPAPPVAPSTHHLKPGPVPPNNSGPPLRRRNLGSYRAEHQRQLEPTDESSKGTRDREIATDFMPMNGSDLTPIDSGSVVRVELPRSALESFGFPMNKERAGERIKADVVVGNDGLARAIRFVR